MTQDKLSSHPHPLDYEAKKKLIEDFGTQTDTLACASLVNFLLDENKSIQELAMNALIRIGNQGVIHHLLPLLDNKEARIRNMAMEIIREIAYDHIALLTPLLKDDREPIRIYLADLLGLIGNPTAIPPLIQCLEDPSTNVRSSAMASLGRLAGEKDTIVTESIEKLLKTEQELWVVFSSIKTLESIGGIRAITPLLNILSSEDEFILSAAIDSLGEIGNLGTISPLLSHFIHPSEAIIERLNASLMSILKRETVCGKAINEKIQADLISFFSLCAGNRKVNTWTRFRAIELLGKLKAGGCLKTLAEIVSDAPPMLQIASAKAMGDIGGVEAEKLLSWLVKSEDPNIKNVAQESLARIGS